MKLASLMGLLSLIAAAVAGCRFDGAGPDSETAAPVQSAGRDETQVLKNPSPVDAPVVDENARAPKATHEDLNGTDGAFVEGEESGTQPPKGAAEEVAEVEVLPTLADTEDLYVNPSALAEPTVEQPWEPLNAADNAEKPTVYREALPPYQSLPANQVVPEKEPREKTKFVKAGT